MESSLTGLQDVRGNEKKREVDLVSASDSRKQAPMGLGPSIPLRPLFWGRGTLSFYMVIDRRGRSKLEKLKGGN